MPIRYFKKQLKINLNWKIATLKLLRILGHCIYEEEKLLIYEDLSNNIQSTFLFVCYDYLSILFLDWQMMLCINNLCLLPFEDATTKPLHVWLTWFNITKSHKRGAMVPTVGFTWVQVTCRDSLLAHSCSSSDNIFLCHILGFDGFSPH